MYFLWFPWNYLSALLNTYWKEIPTNNVQIMINNAHYNTVLQTSSPYVMDFQKAVQCQVKDGKYSEGAYEQCKRNVLRQNIKQCP